MIYNLLHESWGEERTGKLTEGKVFADTPNVPRGQQQQACLEGRGPRRRAGVLVAGSACPQSPYRNLREAVPRGPVDLLWS